MQLVKKSTPRCGLYRELTSAERAAVLAVCGYGTVRSFEEKNTAEKVLLEMRERDLWLMCDCGRKDETPLNNAKHRQDSRLLFLSGFSDRHAVTCPLYRTGRGDEDLTGGGTRREAGNRPVNLRSFLPREERDARISVPDGRDEQAGQKTTRRRLPALGRLLLTLIEEAGLHTLSSVWPAPFRPAIYHIEALKEVTGRLSFARNRLLSAIIRFDAWLSPQAMETAMKELEDESRPWPAGRARAFYLIFMSDSVARDNVIYRGRFSENAFSPARRMHINGEGQEGNRGHYWVILMFIRDAAGNVICSEGYAHALFRRDCPVPVDSELERNTLRGIIRSAEWVSKKPVRPEITLSKPLFDIEVTVEGEKGYVLPDFLVTVTPAGAGGTKTIVVETMGYDDVDYAERKAIQHQGMKTLGLLQTDPPRWPHETDRAFDRHFYGVLKNIL